MLETNEGINTTYQNLWHTIKAVLQNDKGRECERDLYLLVHSPDSRNVWGWVKPKPGTPESFSDLSDGYEALALLGPFLQLSQMYTQGAGSEVE